MIYAIAILIVLFLLYEKHTKSDEVDGSKYFNISDGDSKAGYGMIHKDGVSSDRLKYFVRMEDEFIAMEQRSCPLYTSDAADDSLRVNLVGPWTVK